MVGVGTRLLTQREYQWQVHIRGVTCATYIRSLRSEDGKR